MGVIKNRLRDKFSTLPNAIIESEMSHGAFRVYCYLSSKPNGWKVRNRDIQIRLGIKQNQTLANYFKELIDSGWIEREQSKTKDGRLKGGYDYRIMENPQLGKSLNMENPQLGENHTHSNTDYISNTDSSSKKEKEIIPFQEIIDYLNEKTGKKYRVVETTKKYIRARYLEKYDLDDFKIVIDSKIIEWGKDIKMKKYIRPETLFGTKFPSYRAEAEDRISDDEVKMVY